MELIDPKLVEIALEHAEGSDFERFFHEFGSPIFGVEFTPLGGMHDGGADAFQRQGLFGNSTSSPTIFYQASVQKNHRAKIRDTIQRLREYDRKPSMLYYVTSRAINDIDKEEQYLVRKHNIGIKICDLKWIAANINSSPQTIAAFRHNLQHRVAYLHQFGGATTVSTSSQIGDENTRALCVFLGQEVNNRRETTELQDAVTDSLILWALRDTDPNEMRLTREDILSKIEEIFPSAKPYIRESMDRRLLEMSKKQNQTGREIRWHTKEDDFCLPYETREKIKKENIEDENFKIQVKKLFEDRARKFLQDEGADITTSKRLSEIAIKAIELTFEKQGLELASFLSSEQVEQSERQLNIPDRVEEAICEAGFKGDRNLARHIVLNVVAMSFCKTTNEEQKYFDKLSRTYTLLFVLRNEPRIIEYFKGMSSDFILFVGTDIIIRALSERYLTKPAQRHMNALHILRNAGSTLLITDEIVDEVYSHIKFTDNEFRSQFQRSEASIDWNIASYSPRILIREYFRARLDTELEKRPRNWSSFIGQICSYGDLHTLKARTQIKQYLQEKFGMEFMDRDSIDRLVSNQEVEELTDKIKQSKDSDVLAKNDARHILAVYGNRQRLEGSQTVNPYGYRTWWLTHETLVKRHTSDLVRKHESKYILRPDFIMNFISLSPSSAETQRSFKEIFPTALGIQLANRMKKEVYDQIMEDVDSMWGVDNARAKVRLFGLSNDLKGGRHKKYEDEFTAQHTAVHKRQ